MRLHDEAPTDLVAWWAIAMVGTALDAGISERQIARALDPQILPALIKMARETPDPLKKDTP
jgi:hypothetical protein